MGMAESRGKIGTSMRDLIALWSSTKVSWDDANSQKLEESLLRLLEQDVRVTTSAMDQMGALLSQIRRECDE